MRFGCRSRYISRYVNLKFGFLPFVVASIVAMVFFSAVFAARAPAMGNSADRAWQLSQLVEGVSTAFNPSHGSLSYVQAGHCVSKQIRRHDAACQGCPRCVFLARRKLAASGSSRAPCAFPNLRCYPRCWLFSCLGLWSHPHISPKEHQKERCGHYSAAALLHYVLWCASEYSVVGRISCHDSHDSIRTNVCQ